LLLPFILFAHTQILSETTHPPSGLALRGGLGLALAVRFRNIIAIPLYGVFVTRLPKVGVKQEIKTMMI
jgi:hypothetical protein